MSPSELDRQSPVKIVRWIDVDSEEAKANDDNRALTKQMLKMGFQEPAFMFVDTLGRIWGKGKEGSFYPFHFELGPTRLLYGFKISAKAAN